MILKGVSHPPSAQIAVKALISFKPPHVAITSHYTTARESATPVVLSILSSINSSAIQLIKRTMWLQPYMSIMVTLDDDVARLLIVFKSK